MATTEEVTTSLQSTDTSESSKDTPTYENADTMMAQGSEALHSHLGQHIERALGRGIPEIEVRFANLTAVTQATVVSNDSGNQQLPSLCSTMKNSLLSGFHCKKPVVEKTILNNISGVFAPGTLTLVLGQPGSGKTTLMKALSGRLDQSKSISVDGDIRYNGETIDSLKKKIPQFSSYVANENQHHPILTVRETLDFAHKFSGGELARRASELLCNGSEEENKEAMEATKAMFKHYPEIVIQQLGLQNCQDTFIGDAMVRGVSGGEKKRVTTGEMEFGLKYMAFMDEISTGLDSASTFDIVKTQQSIAKKLRKTIVISLLQPSPEVFDLFDNVLLLSDGEMLYHGPRDQVRTYFTNLGFQVPSNKPTPDFLLDLCSSNQNKYESTSMTGECPQTAHGFATAFRRSNIHLATVQALEVPHAANLQSTMTEHLDHMPEFHQNFFENLITLSHREMVILLRSKAFLGGRVLMIILLGLRNSSLFYQVDPMNAQMVLGSIFSAVLFVALAQATQTPTFVERREVFYKQRAANFFRSSTYVVANLLVQIPLSLIEALTFGSMMYWMGGFVSRAHEYIVFLLYLFLTNLTFTSTYMMVAALAPNKNVGTPLAIFIIMLCINFAGFIVTKEKLPVYLVWLYWMSPISWAFRGMSVSQYRSSDFDVCVYPPASTNDYCQLHGMNMGEYYLSLYDVQSEKYWIAVGLLVLAGMILLVTAVTWAFLEFCRFEETRSAPAVKKPKEEDDDVYVVFDKQEEKKQQVDMMTSRSKHEMLALNIRSEASPQPVTLAFEDIWYSVPNPRNKKEKIQLLQGVSGYALPGTMTALMGSSGAGKTTLLDVISARKSGGTSQGRVLLNGYEASPLEIRRCTGYCEQMDLHSDTSTFREALLFSAMMRQSSSVSIAKKKEVVEDTLNLLELTECADMMIRGSSMEKLKRLTIGVELAAQPSVLFLDEPTSGLDSRSAKMIMEGVRTISTERRLTVICTIHQPSTEIVRLFNSMLLLQRGGHMVYFGHLEDDFSTLVNYFESIPDMPTFTHGTNPADWVLDNTGAGTVQKKGVDFAGYFKNSELSTQLEQMMNSAGITRPSEQYPQLQYASKRSASQWTQCVVLCNRFMKLYWRTTSYNVTRMILAVMLGIIFGLMYGDSSYNSYQGMNSGFGMLWIACVFHGVIAFISVISVVMHERSSFYRERTSQTYNVLWYFVGSTVAEIPYAFVSGLLFTVIFFPLVGFEGLASGVLFWISISLTMLMQIYFGQFFAFLMPSEHLAILAGILVNTIFFLFMGFSPPGNQMPSGYVWLYNITPLRYSLSSLAAIVFGNCPDEPMWDSETQTFADGGDQMGCQVITNAPNVDQTTVKDFTHSIFDVDGDKLGEYLLYQLVCIAVFRVLALVVMRFINHQKK